LFQLNNVTRGSLSIQNANGNVDITLCEFSSNNSTGFGIGIYMTNSNAILTVSRSLFASNRGSQGPAIHVTTSGTLILMDSTVRDNIATSAGGSLYNTGRVNSTISNTTFISNTAPSGGAIFFSATGSLDINSSTFTSNNAVTSNGGAIFSTNAIVIKISGSSFNQNRANQGGVLHLAASSSVEISNSSFTNNTANTMGAVLSLPTSPTSVKILDGTSFSGNTGTYGAIYIFASASGYLLMNETSMFSNFGTGTVGGGALYVNGPINVDLISCNFTGNVAYVSSSGNGGGAIHFQGNATLTITSSFFRANSASRDGGALNIVGTTTLHTVVIENSIFDQNNAQNTGGVASFRTANVTIRFADLPS
jgi:predicted outer membrane repeat protein